jgi:sortase A
MRAQRHNSAAISILRWCSYSLLLAGGAILLSCTYLWAHARLYQALQSRRLNESAQSEPVRGGCQTQQARVGSAIGRLVIARIGVSVVVLEGDDADTLGLGAGRVPGTALPGEGSNMAIAAHRDTFFRPLRNIRKGDVIRFTTRNESLVYEVESTEIVTPSHIEVLDATAEPTMTLITCYPFYYLGFAPDRFVVRARLISSEARGGAGACSVIRPTNQTVNPPKRSETTDLKG